MRPNNLLPANMMKQNELWDQENKLGKQNET